MAMPLCGTNRGVYYIDQPYSARDVMVEAEEVRAHRCLARDVVAFVKFWPGTLKHEFEVN